MNAVRHHRFASPRPMLLCLSVLMIVGCASGDRVPLRTGALYPTLQRTSLCRVDTTPEALEPGHVVLTTMDGVQTTRRVAAVAGERIFMSDGQITRNGAHVAQRTIKKRVICRMGVSARCTCRIAEETLGDRTYRVQHLLFQEAEDDARCDSQYPDSSEIVVPEGHVFLTADNRDGALDSRTWGPVSLDRIQGRVVSCRY